MSMKNIIIATLVALLFTSCGVGNYSVSSGKADECAISFTSAKSQNIVVTIDNNTYNLYSVKEKAYKSDRKIKQTSLNTIRLRPGTHDVKVEVNGEVILTKKVFISTSEHKIIEL